MILVVVVGILFALTLFSAFGEAISVKGWPRDNFKYVVWMGVPFIGLLILSLGS
ncbi:MAG: hypothetical protein ACRD19_05255 [Terriglobia bacterium]